MKIKQAKSRGLTKKKKKKKKKHVVLAVFVSKRGYMQNWAEGSRKRGCFVGIKEDDYKQEGLDGFSWYW